MAGDDGALASDADDSDIYAETSEEAPAERDLEPPTPAKRKREDASPPSKEKKRKVDAVSIASVLIPLEVWQHIFSYVTPRTLGSLLSVCRTFNACLTAALQDLAHDENGILSTEAPDDIWAKSRRLHHPDMPDPLAGCSELEMWSLVRTATCSLCRSPQDPSGNVQPEDSHVASVIWPFALRLCVSCIRKNTVNVSF